MNNIERLTEGFRTRWEQFLTACDAAEELGRWDTEADGQMEAYYTEDLICIVLKLISADGSVSAEEARIVRELFDFQYTPEELRRVADELREQIERLLAEDVRAGLERLGAMDPRLEAMYRELIGDACEIVSESDGLTVAESEFLEQLRAL